MNEAASPGQPASRRRRRRDHCPELQAPAVRRHQHDRPARSAAGPHARHRDARAGASGRSAADRLAAKPRPAPPAAPPAVPHLACPPQRRDDRRHPAARHRPGAAEAGLHLGRPAQSPAAHQMADQAHGCGDRHQSALGRFPRGAAHRDHARRRSRQIPPRAGCRRRFFRRPACRAGAPSAVSAAFAGRRAPTCSSTR